MKEQKETKQSGLAKTCSRLLVMKREISAIIVEFRQQELDGKRFFATSGLNCAVMDAIDGAIKDIGGYDADT